MCIFWGIVPFGVIAFAVVDSIVRAIQLRGFGTRELAFLAFVIFMVAVNELVTKKLAKEARPPHSCDYTCGFPSGHSVMSIGFFTLMFLDAAYRVMPRVPLDFPSAKSHVKAMKGRAKTLFGYTLWEWLIGDFRAFVSVVPLTSAHTLNQLDFCSFAFAWGIFLLPVPFSRVILNDHTPSQVMVGSAVGLLQAALYFMVIRHTILPRMNHFLGKRIGYVLVHNFALPVYEVVSRCYVLLAREKDQDLDGEARLRTMQKLEECHTQLGWYIQQSEMQLTSCKSWFAFDEDHVLIRCERDKLRKLRSDVAEHLAHRQHDCVVSNDSGCSDSDETWSS
mmetsp:Transcript_24148/g.77779  ORF Transcript_24148/g.77779 Transcript_24148/m.77779 type:complete len:335 (-) Transcript_24148:122-1126(-)